ncbi:hypothetical protein COBT_003515, partial [Conglomerata obtusa]
TKSLFLTKINKKSQKTKQKCAITDIQLLAVVKTIRNYGHIPIGNKFVIITDN